MPRARAAAGSAHRVAVIQHPSVALHRDATLKRGVELLEEAAGAGAKLAAFPETWVPGYPEWLWRLRPGEDYKLTGEIHKRLLENSIDLAAGDLNRMQCPGKPLKSTRGLGIHERPRAFRRGGPYNTLGLFAASRAMLRRHPKLTPAH